MSKTKNENEIERMAEEYERLLRLARKLYEDPRNNTSADDRTPLERAAARIEAKILAGRALEPDLLAVVRFAARELARLSQQISRAESCGKVRVRGEGPGQPQVYTEEQVTAVVAGTAKTFYEYRLMDGTFLGDALGRQVRSEINQLKGMAKGTWAAALFREAVAAAVPEDVRVRDKLSLEQLGKLYEKANRAAAKLGKE